MYQQYLESKQKQDKEKKKKEKKKQKKNDKKNKKKQEKLLPTTKNTTGKLVSRFTYKCLYHNVFTTYLHHFLPNDLNLLKNIIQDVITTSTSPPKRRTITLIANSI